MDKDSAGFIFISTRCNSQDILNVIQSAKDIGMQIITREERMLKGMVILEDISKIQEIICAMIDKEF